MSMALRTFFWMQAHLYTTEKSNHPSGLIVAKRDGPNIYHPTTVYYLEDKPEWPQTWRRSWISLRAIRYDISYPDRFSFRHLLRTCFCQLSVQSLGGAALIEGLWEVILRTVIVYWPKWQPILFSATPRSMCLQLSANCKVFPQTSSGGRRYKNYVLNFLTTYPIILGCNFPEYKLIFFCCCLIRSDTEGYSTFQVGQRVNYTILRLKSTINASFYMKCAILPSKVPINPRGPPKK